MIFYFLLNILQTCCLWSKPKTNLIQAPSVHLLNYFTVCECAASEVLHHVLRQQLHEGARAQCRGGPAQSWTFTNAPGRFKQHSSTTPALFVSRSVLQGVSKLGSHTESGKLNARLLKGFTGRQKWSAAKLLTCCMLATQRETVEMDVAESFYDVAYFFGM